MIPAFKGKTLFPTVKTRRQNAKNEESFDLRTNLEFLRKCCFKKVVSLMNTLAENIKNQIKLKVWNSEEEK